MNMCVHLMYYLIVATQLSWAHGMGGRGGQWELCSKMEENHSLTNHCEGLSS